MSQAIDGNSTAKPLLKDEWHPTRNGELKFESLSPNSSRKVWWLCSKNLKHEWDARFRNRLIDGDGCPYCLETVLKFKNVLVFVWLLIGLVRQKAREK